MCRHPTKKSVSSFHWYLPDRFHWYSFPICPVNTNDFRLQYNPCTTLNYGFSVKVVFDTKPTFQVDLWFMCQIILQYRKTVVQLNIIFLQNNSWVVLSQRRHTIIDVKPMCFQCLGCSYMTIVLACPPDRHQNSG